CGSKMIKRKDDNPEIVKKRIKLYKKQTLPVIGPPGSGKDTVGSIVSTKTRVPMITMGDLLRSSLKGKFKKMVDNGELIPDRIIYKILRVKTKKLDSFILNGFPRKLSQAKNLERWNAIDMVFFLDVPVKEVLKRLSKRYVCLNCGFVSKNPGDCQNCGSKMIKRKDDNPEIVKKRIKLYKKQTLPVIKFYKKIKKLVAVKGRNSRLIAEKIEKTLKSL
ncbi:MAG: nucleoside monophosphate kinase, partial [Candidatus Marsarchaeota archaeon]|nr:nucleoside monophosphate kinase [Candidatus Marsarchaeota archaeon]